MLKGQAETVAAVAMIAKHLKSARPSLHDCRISTDLSEIQPQATRYH